jgi:hypothetical protein
MSDLRGDASWWTAQEETCDYCLHRYALATEVRCIACDRAVCAECAVLIVDQLWCPECRVHPTARRAREEGS